MSLCSGAFSISRISHIIIWVCQFDFKHPVLVIITNNMGFSLGIGVQFVLKVLMPFPLASLARPFFITFSYWIQLMNPKQNVSPRL